MLKAFTPQEHPNPRLREQNDVLGGSTLKQQLN